MMMKVGLTGGIGSGKSTIAKVFSTLGIPIYNSDERAKELIQSNAQVKQSIVAEFGEEAYLNGEYNREFIAQQAFNNAEKLAKLNSIVHPAVRADFESWCETHTSSPYIIKEAAILFESGAYKGLDKTINVSASEQLRAERVAKRDASSIESVQQRMKNQLSDSERKELADFTIVNDDSQLVIPKVLELHQLFLKS